MRGCTPEPTISDEESLCCGLERQPSGSEVIHLAPATLCEHREIPGDAALSRDFAFSGICVGEDDQRDEIAGRVRTFA
jgi:hypothetical protein